MNDPHEMIYVKIYDVFNQQTVCVSMREVIKRMVASQMPIEFEIEALKAQAIIARTLIVRKSKVFGGDGCRQHREADLCNGEHCGVFYTIKHFKEQWGVSFEEKWRKIERAVKETEGNIITVNNKPIVPKFHKICGGSTENSENVEGNQTIYLRKVLCDYCKEALGYEHSLNMSIQEIEDKLKVKTLKAIPTYGSIIDGMIEDVERDEEGRVKSAKIGGKVFEGTQLMDLLGLDSTRFGWKPVVFEIKVQGKGHGLGLCQYGANEMAKQGYGVEEILKYYFTGIRIKQMDPPSIDAPLSGKTIVIDAGHGGDNEEDVTGPTGLREKDVNLSISKKLASILRDAGCKVYETRVKDEYVSLGKRAGLANEIMPDFFLSIHQNYFSNPNIAGSEIYHYRGDKEGEILADYILEALEQNIGTVKRGRRIAEFYLLREVRSSVLQIEITFITNPEEEKKLKDEDFRQKAAKAIYEGIIKYYRYV